MNNQSATTGSRLIDSSGSEESTESRLPISVKEILAPTDLTREGHNGIDYAAALASRFGAELILLHVYEAKGSPDYSADVIDDTIVDDYQLRVEDKMKEWCAEISEIHPHSNMCFRSGKPSEEIVLAARDREADLIVISTHKRHTYSHLIDGNDAEKILKRAPCPVPGAI